MTGRMIVHRIRAEVAQSGITCCTVCGHPVRWVRSDLLADDSLVGHWVHDELAASMARHPAGRSRPMTTELETPVAPPLVAVDPRNRPDRRDPLTDPPQHMFGARHA